jgi:hypothetical protein
MSGEPQGGLKMRRVAPAVAVAMNVRLRMKLNVRATIVSAAKSKRLTRPLFTEIIARFVEGDRS